VQNRELFLEQAPQHGMAKRNGHRSTSARPKEKTAAAGRAILIPCISSVFWENFTSALRRFIDTPLRTTNEIFGEGCLPFAFDNFTQMVTYVLVTHDKAEGLFVVRTRQHFSVTTYFCPLT